MYVGKSGKRNMSKFFMYLIPEVLYRLAWITRRNRKLYECVMILLKILGRHSKVWSFDEKNYLGRRYLVRYYYLGSCWYKYEDYRIKWER